MSLVRKLKIDLMGEAHFNSDEEFIVKSIKNQLKDLRPIKKGDYIYYVNSENKWVIFEDFNINTLWVRSKYFEDFIIGINETKEVILWLSFNIIKELKVNKNVHFYTKGERILDEMLLKIINE